MTAGEVEAEVVWSHAPIVGYLRQDGLNRHARRVVDAVVSSVLLVLTITDGRDLVRSIQNSNARGLEIHFSDAVGAIGNHARIFIFSKAGLKTDSTAPTGRAKRVVVPHVGIVL